MVGLDWVVRLPDGELISVTVSPGQHTVDVCCSQTRFDPDPHTAAHELTINQARQLRSALNRAIEAAEANRAEAVAPGAQLTALGCYAAHDFKED